MNKCRICKVRDATKKNSHQLPSFLGAMISSNGDYRRGKELMFTFNKYQSGVYAYGLDSTKWEEIFDGLTDKRIRQISVNPISEDYVFCPQCEKMLGEYLESPYSVFFKEGGSIAPDIPLMFWVSVVWRLSTQGTNGFNLGGRLLFLGILFAGPELPRDGEIVTVNNLGIRTVSRTNIPINLGYYIKAKEIMAFKEMLRSIMDY